MAPERSTLRILLLGTSGTGKTTLMAQLLGRVQAGTGQLRARGMPESLAAVRHALERLEQGRAVAHTASGTDVMLSLPASTLDGAAVDLLLPDYAGEALKAIVEGRSVRARWTELTRQAGQWLLMIRPSLHPEIRDMLTRPNGELLAAPSVAPAAAPSHLPPDMLMVELLQILLFARGPSSEPAVRTPRLTVVLSCWDELGPEVDTSPATILAHRMPLLHSYCQATWHSTAYQVVGLSAQGRELHNDEPAEEYLDHGPQQMGWIVSSDGRRDPDLTRLIVG